ncbi:proteasome cyclosome repeat-containing protein [Cyclospora cayetanensis]|uniref:Proteasome cyclosome repeat-containing protein n=1 Tax=Cyclospora cayetanensis TaxID=88456 RepID=A0A1D3CXM9_9EIME|nr:proteasome cyclosome repeat-containing protein [Cyclospora cayetanensis]
MNLHALVPSKAFRTEVLGLLIRLYREALDGLSATQQPEVYRQLCRCLIVQGDVPAVAALLNSFLTAPSSPALERPQLVAYQIAFDLMDLVRSAQSLYAVPALQQLDMLASDCVKQPGSRNVHLGKNLDWMGRAVSWTKFSATASIGAIHRGNMRSSLSVLETYLPPDTPGVSSASGAPSTEGGALFALGLIHSGAPSPRIRALILSALKQTNQTDKEPLLHGGCLGLGLVCLGDANDTEAYEALRTLLFLDSAVIGEAAALGIGLLLMGSGNAAVAAELLGYAKETQHEKIGRACAVALSLISFQKEEEADELIGQCLAESDPLIRYGGVFAIGLAYCATGKKRAVERLLHLGVADVNDDVRRAAVLSLGFVLCAHKEELLRVMRLLCGSYNPHVRYGAAVSLGVGLAGSGLREAGEVLKALSSDPTDFVRQGAFIGMGFLYQLQHDAAVSPFRESLKKVIRDKHEDPLARFGALIAAGLVDAGGFLQVPSTFSTKLYTSAFSDCRRHPEAKLSCSFFSPRKEEDAADKKPLDTSAPDAAAEVSAEGFAAGKQGEEEQKEDAEGGTAIEVDGQASTTKEHQQQPQQPLHACLRMPCGWRIACSASNPSQFSYPPPLNMAENKTDGTKSVKAILSTSAKRQAAARRQKESSKEAQKTTKATAAAKTKGGVNFVDAFGVLAGGRWDRGNERGDHLLMIEGS